MIDSNLDKLIKLIIIVCVIFCYYLFFLDIPKSVDNKSKRAAR